MGEEDTLRDVVPLRQRPGDPERHRVAVPAFALGRGSGHAGRDRSTAVLVSRSDCGLGGSPREDQVEPQDLLPTPETATSGKMPAP
jgi:hypothetical protein